jgi:hypothetical protein
MSKPYWSRLSEHFRGRSMSRQLAFGNSAVRGGGRLPTVAGCEIRLIECPLSGEADI